MVEVRKNSRNNYVDFLRGLAILVVVLGHTMTGTTVASEKTLVFNIVWSFQMPLFFVISGYVIRFSRSIASATDLWSYAKRRTLAYLLPWVLWTLIRGFVYADIRFITPSFIFWHMDTGYWFLFTIWVISMLFGVTMYLTAKIRGKRTMHPIPETLIQLSMLAIAMGLLLVVGKVFGMAFLGIKLTLYYMCFYIIGFVYGKMSTLLEKLLKYSLMTLILSAISLLIWVVFLLKFNLYEASDSGLGIVIRFASALTACIAICGLLKPVYEKTAKWVTSKYLVWAGKQSLEIYVMHTFFVGIVMLGTKPSAATFLGAGIILLNYLITMIIVTVLVWVLNTNRYAKMMLFGKFGKSLRQ